MRPYVFSKDKKFNIQCQHFFCLLISWIIVETMPFCVDGCNFICSAKLSFCFHSWKWKYVRKYLHLMELEIVYQYSQEVWRNTYLSTFTVHTSFDARNCWQMNLDRSKYIVNGRLHLLQTPILNQLAVLFLSLII